MQKYMSKYLFISVLLLGLASCEPQQDGAVDIGLPPSEATFTIEEADAPNTYTLRSTTTAPDIFLYHWDFEHWEPDVDVIKNGQVVEMFYKEKGTYDVTFSVFNHGGKASSTQTIEVPEDAPIDCDSFEELKFITNCEEKVWRLIPEAGALFVGPGDGSGTTWFANTEDDVDIRTCQFDDEWTFAVGGTMEYDTKGDIWGEDYLGFDFECAATADLGSDVAAWGDGTHIFEVIAPSDDAPAQLKVSGLGAFIGLPKVTNGEEVTLPVSETIYDIIGMTNVGGQDILELEVNFGPGVWRFKLASF